MNYFSALRATSDVMRERQRQVEEKNWTLEHDDGHTMPEWRDLVDRYMRRACMSDGVLTVKYTREDLVQAAALVVAAIEALDRRAEKETADGQAETE